MQIYSRRLDLLNTWRDTTMVLECVWICRPLGVPRDLTKSCSCAICLFRLLMSCNTHTGPKLVLFILQIACKDPGTFPVQLTCLII